MKRYQKICAYASVIFKYAMKLGKVHQNPMKLVTSPKRLELDESEKKNFYTKEQVIEFLKYAEAEENRKAYVLFRLLAYSGMRKGESLALVWKDLDFKASKITITKSLERGENLLSRHLKQKV